jgi:oligopeptide transport system substrate-binding protein
VTVLTDDGGRSNVDVFEDEAVDWVPISPDDAAWIRYDRDLGPQLRWSDQWTVEYLGFDTTRPPFDDPEVRRAVGMAVDWRRLARGQAEGRSPATTLVPPGIAGRPDGDYLPAHDPRAARELLARAGYPGGEGFPRVALATYGAGAAEAIAHEVERELGIEVDVEVRPFSQHAELLETDTPRMWTLAWNADYPHVHDFLGLLLRSDSSANAGGWSDPAYDALIDQAASTTDVAEQARLYDAAQRLIGREVPVVPLAYGGSWALSREGLLGAIPSGVGILRYAGLAWQG